MSDRIMVVDDDQELAELLGMLLDRHGYKTLAVFNGEDALKQVCDFQPAVILQDYMLPDIKGDELLIKLKERCPDSYVVMMTARGNEEVVAELFKAGASDYLKKPIESDKLFSTVENVLKLRSSESMRDELAGALMRHSREFLLINTLSTALNAEIPRQDKYRIAADIVMKGMRADYVRISMKDPDTGRLKLLVSASTDKLSSAVPALDQEMVLADYVAGTNRAAAVPDFRKEDRFNAGESFIDTGITSALAVPMLLNGQTVGVLGAYMKARTNFPAFVMKLLTSFANLIALDIENEYIAERLNKLERLVKGVCATVGERIMVVDRDHNIQYANEASARSVNLSVKDVIGQQCCWLFHNSKAPIEGCPVDEAIRTGGRVEKEMVIGNPGVRYMATAEPLFDDDGNIDSVVENLRPL